MGIVRPDQSSSGGGGGGSVTVTDGTHSVANVTTLDFTAGVTVSDAGGGQANASVTAGAPTFTPTATKTANYTAAAGEYVVGDSTGGAFTVTLPAAPANGTVVAVQQIGSANAITVAAGVGDTINATTNTSLGLTRRSAMYEYRALDKVWFALALATNPVLSVSVDGTTLVNTGTSTAPSLHTGTLDVIAATQPAVAAVALNGQKITGLANGAAPTDAMAVGQLQPNASGGLVNGAIAATLPRYVALSGSLALTSGTLYLVGVELAAGVTLTSVTFVSAFGGAINAGTHQLFGVFDDSLGSSSGTAYALLRGSVDDTNTAWAQNTPKTLALTSTYVTTRAGFHYLGIMCTATTAPQLRATTADSVIGALASVLCGASSAGLTALPNPAAAPTFGGGVVANAWVS